MSVAEPPPPAVAPSEPERVALSSDHWAIVCTEPSQAAAIADDWDALAANAAEPNVFYERWSLEPAWQAFGGLTHLVLVYRRGNSPAEPPVPLGLFPMQIGSSDSRLLGAVASVWSHPYGFLRTPLLRRGAALEAIDVWVRTLDKLAPHVGLAVLERVHGEGPFAQALVDYVRHRGGQGVETQRYNRAVCRPLSGQSADDYCERAISKKQRRELARQRRRLADLGELAVTRPPAADFIEAFLMLEAGGWKGDQGSAIAASETDAAYFTQVIAEADRRGQLDGSLMSLDGRPIAAKLNFVSAGPLARRTAFACKIGYDETLKKYSPGVLLELDTIDWMHRPDAPAAIDSCALPDHPMIDRLWSERVQMQHAVVALPHAGRIDRVRLAALRLKTWRKRSRRRPADDPLRANY